MKKIKLVTTVIATLCSVCIYAQTDIRTAAELAAIGNDAALLQGSYILLSDITVENWEPVGSFATPFEGQFDGQGHTITVKSISSGETKGNPPVEAEVGAGLFCAVGKKGVVKNLKIAGEVAYNSGTRTLYSGAVAGKNAGTIQNCISVCKITAEGGKTNLGRAFSTALAGAAISKVFLYTNGAYAGGLTGVNIGKIENCYSESHISIDGEGIKCGGGIAGGNGSDAGGTIAQCIATGTVTIAGSGGVGTKGYYRSAGGIAGQNCKGGTIENCVALNESLTAYNVKCMVGINTDFDAGNNPAYGKVKDCYYQKGIMIFKTVADADKDKKAAKKAETGKGMEGRPVEIAETYTQTWWETPKGNRSKFAFAFGADDTAPWTWNDAEKRPTLYWEHKQGID
jgi:hypothetical protein